MVAAHTAPRISDLELIRLIGSGSYGDVWLARGVTGAFRAVKVVWRNRFLDLRPYEREFEGISRFATVSLREPSQLALLHAGRCDSDGFFYYVMELADDRLSGREINPETYAPLTLKDYAQKCRGDLPVPTVVTLGTQLARALGSLHAAGLVHRDIKPSNIVFVGGVPKLADVGLVANASAQLTFVGTEGFVPPEGPGAPAADVFSLGKVLYELATGCDRNEFPRLPTNLAARADRREFLELNEVLLRACEPEAKNRFADAGALLDELLLLQAGKSIRRLRSAERRITRTWRIAVVLGVIATVAGTGAWIERQRARQEMILRAKAEAERDGLTQRTVYSATLAQAQRALDEEDFGRARRLLTDARPKTGQVDLRGCEWPVLWALAQGDPAEIVVPGGPAIDRLALSRDGKFLGVHDENKTLRIFALADRKELQGLAGVQRLGGFSTEGDRVLGTDLQFRPLAWNWRTSETMRLAEAGVFRPINVGTDGRLVSFRDGSPAALTAWAGQSERLDQTLHLDQAGEIGGEFYRAALARRSPLVALAMIHGRGSLARWSLHIIDLNTGRRLYREELSSRITALTFGPQDTMVICAFGDTAELAALQFSPSAGWLWRTPTSGVSTNELAMNAAGTMVGAAGRDNRIRFFDIQSGAARHSLRGATHTTLAMASADGEFFSASAGGELRCWPSRPPFRPTEFAGLWTGATGGRFFCLSPDGLRLAATTDGQSVRILSLTEPSAAGALVSDANQPLVFSADGNSLWVFSNSGRLEKRIIAEGGGTAESFAVGNIALARSLPAVSSDRRWLSFGLADGSLATVDLTAPEPPRIISAHRGAIWWTAISSQGELVASSGEDRRVNLWRITTGERVASWTFDEASVHADFSPDGRWLALAGENGSLQIVSLGEKRLHKTVFSGLARIQTVKFSPGSDRLALGGPEATLQLLETIGWSEVAIFRPKLAAATPHEQTIDLIEFLPAGGWTAYLTDGRIKVWSSGSPR